MSFRLVSLDEVKRQLVYDNALSDAALTFRLEAVSGALVDFIGEHSEHGLDGWADSGGPFVDSNGDPELDSNGVSIVPAHVQAATICAMAAWDEQRGADLITPAVKSLLARTRRPVVV